MPVTGRLPESTLAVLT
uniref:NSL1 n=1 Tax=Arundo donax TaxID=35708 RepID=A0A0A9T3Z1_ARUDO